MIAVDMNVLIRLIVEDDELQVRRVHALIRDQDRVLITWTVLLELGWVLASRQYQLGRDRIAASIRTLSNIPNVEIPGREALLNALIWFEHGLDFADALHRASIEDGCEFVTFDRSFVRTAEQIGIGNVRIV